MDFKIRPGTKADAPAVHQMIVDLAIYEKAPDEVETNVEELIEDGFGANPIYELLVAELGGEVVGFALYYTSYSTWKGRCLYLEDFFVQEQHRKKGIGAALFEAVIAEAKARKAKRMEWQVLEWNEPAINFYKKYGATLDPEWLNGRFFEADLTKL